MWDEVKNTFHLVVENIDKKLILMNALFYPLFVWVLFLLKYKVFKFLKSNGV